MIGHCVAMADSAPATAQWGQCTDTWGKSVRIERGSDVVASDCTNTDQV